MIYLEKKYCKCYFLVNRVTINTTTAIIAITIKIPAPIPTLKMPSTTEQLEKVSKMDKRNANLNGLFCMVFVFN